MGPYKKTVQCVAVDSVKWSLKTTDLVAVFFSACASCELRVGSLRVRGVCFIQSTSCTCIDSYALSPDVYDFVPLNS